MKAIPLTDKELADKQKAFDSMNELVYDKKKEEKDARHIIQRKKNR